MSMLQFETLNHGYNKYEAMFLMLGIVETLILICQSYVVGESYFVKE